MLNPLSAVLTWQVPQRLEKSPKYVPSHVFAPTSVEADGVGEAEGVGRGVGVTGTNATAVSTCGTVAIAVAGSTVMNQITPRDNARPRITATGMKER